MARTVFSDFCISFLEAPSAAMRLRRWITTGHFMHRVFLRQHFFLGLVPTSLCALVLLTQIG